MQLTGTLWVNNTISMRSIHLESRTSGQQALNLCLLIHLVPTRLLIDNNGWPPSGLDLSRETRAALTSTWPMQNDSTSTIWPGYLLKGSQVQAQNVTRKCNAITHLAVSYCLTVKMVSSMVLLQSVLTDDTKKFSAKMSCWPFLLWSWKKMIQWEKHLKNLDSRISQIWSLSLQGQLLKGWGDIKQLAIG